MDDNQVAGMRYYLDWGGGGALSSHNTDCLTAYHGE